MFLLFFSIFCREHGHFLDIFKYQWLILGHATFFSLKFENITEEKLVVSKLTQERRTASEQPPEQPYRNE